MAPLAVQTRRAALRRVQGLITAAVMGACLTAAVVAVGKLRSEPRTVASPPADTPTVHVIGEDVPTSFGLVTVKRVVATTAGHDEQLSVGPSSNAVDNSVIDVRVTAIITNLTDNVVAYRVTQFELIDSSGKVVPVEPGSFATGDVKPLAAVSTQIDFISTARAQPFEVRFTDPATNSKVLIEVGSPGCIVAPRTGVACP